MANFCRSFGLKAAIVTGVATGIEYAASRLRCGRAIDLVPGR